MIHRANAAAGKHLARDRDLGQALAVRREGDLVDLALTQPLNAVEAAIKQQDAQKFATAYDQLGQGCNAWSGKEGRVQS